MPGVWSEPVLGELKRKFAKQYGAAGELTAVWAPGRVNLIGEHIDYAGLPVLPMAIQRGTLILFRRRTDDQIRISSTLPSARRRTFRLRPRIRPYQAGDWGNYAKAAAQVVATHYGVTTGIDALVHSTLPVAAGLSSSSALVVGVALALMDQLASDVRPFELMERLALGERYVGLQGGGMDQAVILGARANAAVCVSFVPLRLELVPIPTDWRFIVAHSLTPAAKTGAARHVYNDRTRECAEALEIMLDAMGVRGTVAGYRGLIDAFGPGPLLETAESQLSGPLLKRFRHVVVEADRVLEAVRSLERGDLATFGPLLCDSHRSLRDDYEVSTPALDELTEMAVSVGAAGARLTGAGLGGCAIAVCRADAESTVLEALRARFYGARIDARELAASLFRVSASGGARLQRV